MSTFYVKQLCGPVVFTGFHLGISTWLRSIQSSLLSVSAEIKHRLRAFPRAAHHFNICGPPSCLLPERWNTSR